MHLLTRATRFASTALRMILLAGLPLWVGGCGTKTETCISCHSRLEEVSPTHRSCTACHGGVPSAATGKKAHQGMHGPRNPSDPAHWEETCGRCHRYQLERVRSTIMFTNAGMIRNIQLSWEGDDGRSYSARGGKAFDAGGNSLEYRPVAELENLSGELYRKFCSRCHIGTENGESHTAGHASGCAACHFPFNDISTYRGEDTTVQGKRPASASHRMTGLPGNDVCSRCHSRSGRIAFSYQGLYDGNNGMVPTRNGLPGPVMASGGRNLTHIVPDVHFAAGMDCIDCHTSRDIMGDSYSYRNMYLQTEIGCEDCHGSPTAPPRYKPIVRENEEAVRESKQYRFRMEAGRKMVLTTKGRPYSNVWYEGGRVKVLGKRSGKVFTSKVITGTPEHAVHGHERLECFTCHSRTVVQCYGCHTTYDRSATATDFILKKETPGEFSETEDYRALYPFPLALNQRGRISPVTPGCQTFVTVIEEDGTRSRNEYIARFKGKQQLRFAPFYSHNTGKRAIGCMECHGNPAFLGFGQHVASSRGIESTMLCEKSESKPLDGFLTMRGGKITAWSAITREHSRPLNQREVSRTLAVNTCLICHDRPADPIYRKELDFGALEDTLHRRLLDRR
ncbi:selenite/tellurite reduction operon c-type cytochrome ExtM [Geobacter sp. DSM 9736]|uniref:selenite/tellurite reduction operon c-type cytochrome ExtM n=1 Tax=Geobacter sp. DSM 9736 TaxID=1277350 RepID=UPI000B50FB63|nr:selenite/tellurite reduction operon c-type cytochrome ExtM [Geobacter sp. DSM 9736]